MTPAKDMLSVAVASRQDAPDDTREWLVTNGIGGYASSTVAGHHTRRYHGLLVAALDPPLGRTVMWSRVDETVTYRGKRYPLATTRWASGTVEPRGHELLVSFRLEGTVPVWRWALADAIIERRIAMVRGENATDVVYRVVRAAAPVTLSASLIVNHRDFHHTTTAGSGAINMGLQSAPEGLVVRARSDAAALSFSADSGTFRAGYEWYRGYALTAEQARGLDAVDDALYVGSFGVTLSHGGTARLRGSAVLPDAVPGAVGASAVAATRERDGELVARALAAGIPDDPLARRLALAADAFVVSRPVAHETAGGDGAQAAGTSVIAGYPWFSDWGRDTMISLRGLTLATGRPELAADVLKTYARFVDGGMIPNRFPDDGTEPEYNTVDATLWYVEALRATWSATGDTALVEQLFEVIERIVAAHERGTRYGIAVDGSDGLLRAGERGVQLTWMDAKVGDWVVTPRIGKCVEINALWFNALTATAEMAAALGRPERLWRERAATVKASFQRFFDPTLGHCVDVLDGPGGDERLLRPNQIFAVSLTHSALDQAQQRAIVDAVGASLVTPYGLRSLAPSSPGYQGHYGGGRRARDGAYHQGTVWGWLLGPYALAYARATGDRAAAREFLAALEPHLLEHGVGSVAEVFDGNAPHAPRGCIAQAWSVAETLWAWRELAR